MTEDKSLSRLIKKIKMSIVTIKTDETIGTGFIADKRGIVITNAHVIGSSVKCEVTLPDETKLNGRLLISYFKTDIAFIKIQTNKKLKEAVLNKNENYQVGDTVLAYGNPLGYEHSVTKGIISAINRIIGDARYIQTDVAINPGNSGGPLINMDGEIIGINTLKIEDASGIGFAIPIVDVMSVINKALKDFDTISKSRYCSVCGSYTASKEKWCSNCGAELESEALKKKSSKDNICPACGVKNKEGAVYCKSCGHNVSGVVYEHK